MSTETLKVVSPDLERAIAGLTSTSVKRIAGRTIPGPIRAMANEVRNQARRELLAGHPKARKMRDHIRVRFKGFGLNFTGGIRSTGAPSNLIVGGVKPHRIAPGGVMPLWDGHGALFTGKGNVRKGNGAGITGFATKVEHPGIAADPFFDRGIEKSQPVFDHQQQLIADGMASGLAASIGGH